MAYTPDATDVTQPTEDKLAQTAAAEFRALKAYVQQIVSGAGLGAQTTGMIADFPSTSAPPGWLILEGQILARNAQPALWAFASSIGVLVSEATWASGSNYGSFSDGDGATTFRLPDFRSMVRKGADRSRAFGNSAIGKYVPPLSRHKHRTAAGADFGAAFYSWMDGSGLPIFGSEVEMGALRITVGAAGGASNIRIAYTDEPNTGSVPIIQPDWNIVANNGVLTCIKT